MDVADVPQEGNRTLDTHRKAMYAKTLDGSIVLVPSRGSHIDETVTLQAVQRMRAQTDAARVRALCGHTSPLEVWMYHRRMDVALLAQASGIWAWRVKRHFRPQCFQSLSPRLLSRYAQALGITTEQLQALP